MRISLTGRPIALLLLCPAAGVLLWGALAGVAGQQPSSIPSPAPSGASELPKYAPSPEELQASYQRERPGPVAGVYKAQITPHWFQNNTRFWYRNDLRGGAKEFILVEAEQGQRKEAFDHKKLAAGLSKAAGKDY